MQTEEPEGDYAWPHEASPFEDRVPSIPESLERAGEDETVFVSGLGDPATEETVEVDGLALSKYFVVDAWTREGFRNTLVCEVQGDGSVNVLRRETTTVFGGLDAFDTVERRDSWVAHAVLHLRADASRRSHGLTPELNMSQRAKGTSLSDAFLREVLRLSAEGLTQSAIAHRMGAKHASSASRWLAQAKRRGIGNKEVSS